MIWSTIAWALAAMILACLLATTVTDLTSRIIPNRLVLIVLCCGFGLRLVSGTGLFLASLLSALAVLAVLSLLARYDLLGWGDVKLIAAVTFAVPASRVIPLLFAIIMAGGLLSCVYLAVRFALRHGAPSPHRVEPAAHRIGNLRRLARREGARILANEPMPYALAVFGGLAFGLATE
jgi:prepilin peptidase CpaA